MRTLLLLAALGALTACTPTVRVVALGTFDDSQQQRLSGVSPVDSALADSDHLIVDFDAEPPADTLLFRGVGVSAITAWPDGEGCSIVWAVPQPEGQPQTWHLRLRPAARRQVQLVGGDPEHYDGQEQAFLLRADGVVCAMSADGKEWLPALRGEAVTEDEE